MTTVDFYEFELKRLLFFLNEHCHQVYDATQVRITVADWAYGLAKGTIQFCFEDETMNKTIGMRVNKSSGKYGAGAGQVAYGIISNNIAAYDSSEGLFEGMQEVSTEDKARWKHLGTLAMVSWFMPDGTLSFTSWEELKNLTQEESK
jgi:hypothetical protein